MLWLKGSYMKIFSLLSVSILSVLHVNSAFAQEVVPFAIGEWSPYTGKNINNNGMAAEIVTAACSAAGLTAKYKYLPWKRAEANVADGAYFGTFPYKETKEREGRFLFSKTLFSSSFALLTSKSNKRTANFKYSRPDDLKGFSVGVIAGTDAVKLPLEQAGVRVEEVAGAEQNLKKLEFARIDFYIDDRAVIYEELKKNYSADKMSNFVFLDSGFGEKNEFKIMVSLKHSNSKALLDKINEGLTKLTESGEHKKITAKYGL